jgi:hypothetical protein
LRQAITNTDVHAELVTAFAEADIKSAMQALHKSKVEVFKAKPPSSRSKPKRYISKRKATEKRKAA